MSTALADLPDTVAAGAVTLAVGMTGELRLRTVLLETADEVDAALHGAATLRYRPPGNDAQATPPKTSPP